MELLPILFGLACMATVAFAVRSGKSATIFLAVVLTYIWAASNIGWQLDAIDMYPIMDTAVAIYALTIARNGGWQRVFFVAAVSQIILHVIYAILGVGYVVAYLFWLDVTFAIELAAVSWEGLRNARMDLSSWFHRLRRLGLGAGFFHAPKRLRK